MSEYAALPPAGIAIADGVPRSLRCDDIYFSRAGGSQETEHVFLHGNDLPERWQDAASFVIAELGFGSGLNFLTTVRHHHTHAPADATLTYIAIEGFPLTRDELGAVLTLQRDLGVHAQALLAAYPARIPGWHCLSFGRVTLHLFFGEVATGLEDMRAQGDCVDAWYLDGFAPAKNPEMWAPEILSQLGAMTAADGSFATFTAARQVREALHHAGFTVEKVKGFGHKRDMLRGKKTAMADIAQHAVAQRPMERTALVVGAGIAGACLAYRLAEEGYRVTVLEAHTPASGASGNAAGVLFPPLHKRWTASMAFYFAAYTHLQCHQVSWPVVAYHRCGMLRLPRDPEEAGWLTRLQSTLAIDSALFHWVDAATASHHAGLTMGHGGIFFPEGCWLSPQVACHALLAHPNITVHAHTSVQALERMGEGWQVECAQSRFSSRIVCLTAGPATAALLTAYGLPLRTVGGQVSQIEATQVRAPLRIILCRKGYLIPGSHRYLLGATYHRDALYEVTHARHQENLTELEHMLPGWYSGVPSEGRSSVRTTTPDRLPIIGALDHGLYVSAGHGSRGLLSAPLAASMVLAQIRGTRAPIAPSLAACVHPQRFRHQA
jgi:tRNA 5-methylaminomethyl-2-thiouridine biosynthesis bifunctional protein